MLIPYCARHHPLQSQKQRVPGTPSTSFAQGGERLGWPSLRASTEHSIRLGPEQINPECAVREHKGQPCRPAPPACVRDARAGESSQPPGSPLHPCVPPTVISSTRIVGSPTPTGTVCPSLPQVPIPSSSFRSWPTIDTLVKISGPLPMSVAPLTGRVTAPSSIK